MAIVILDNLPFDAADLEDDARNASLGRFMTAWAQVEVVCGFMFQNMTGLSRDVGSIVFDRIGAKEQIQIVNDLANEMDPSGTRDALITQMKAVEEGSQKRNKITHARWGAYNTEPARFWNGLTQGNINDIAMETDKGKKPREKSVHTVTDLDGLTAGLTATRDALMQLLSAVESPKNELHETMERLRACKREKLELQGKLHELWHPSGRPAS